MVYGTRPKKLSVFSPGKCLGRVNKALEMEWWLLPIPYVGQRSRESQKVEVKNNETTTQVVLRKISTNLGFLILLLLCGPATFLSLTFMVCFIITHFRFSPKTYHIGLFYFPPK